MGTGRPRHELIETWFDEAKGTSVRCSAVIVIAIAAMTVPARSEAQQSAPPPPPPQPPPLLPVPANRVVYDAAFFAAFSPANALQIVQRVPGFTLDEGDTEVRGFSQAAGNVVINGQRPSLKSDTLETVLARIPASRVVRVEIASGDQFGADYAGKPQVVNVVLSDSGGLAGTVEATMRREFTGALIPEGSVAALLRRGPSTFNLSVELDNSDSTEIGYDRLADLPSDLEQELRLKLNRIKEPTVKVTASWALEESDYRSAHLNGSVTSGTFTLGQANHVIPRAGDERDDTLDQHYYGRTIELSGDVTRPFMGGGIKLVGLATRRYRNRDDLSLLVADDDLLGGSSQNQRDWRDESLLRLVWNRSNLAGWSVEAGVEGALNQLNSHVELFDIDANDERTRVDLPLDDALVKEYRGEAFLNVGRSLTRQLRLDLGLNYEASRLSVSGDVSARRTLQFLKPRVTLDWRSGAWHAQFSAKRTVAQLNFDDFVSFAELSTDRVNGGNAELQPQRAWELLASFDRTILGDGRVKLDIGYDFIQKVQDRVPTPEGFDAPGNLGNGSSFSLVGNLDLPLSRLGLRGGRLSLYGSYVDTSVRDPYTFTWRPFSNYSLFYFTAELRQDLGKFAWSLSAEGSTRSIGYRRDELDAYQGVMPIVSAYVEYRPAAKWIITLGADNLLDLGVRENRRFFLPDRTTPDPYLYELRVRTQHIIPYLTIKHSFN